MKNYWIELNRNRESLYTVKFFSKNQVYLNHRRVLCKNNQSLTKVKPSGFIDLCFQETFNKIDNEFLYFTQIVPIFLKDWECEIKVYQGIGTDLSKLRKTTLYKISGMTFSKETASTSSLDYEISFYFDQCVNFNY